MTFIDDISPEDLLIVTKSIAIALSKGKTTDEINVLGNVFIDIGRKMLLLASKERYLSSTQQQSNLTTTTEDNTTVEL